MDDELTDLADDDELVESMFKSVKNIAFEQPLSKKSLNFFSLTCKFRYVSSVFITVELSQALLERLPDALPDLVHFFYHPTFFGKHFLNFNFMAKFRSLSCFHIDNCPISIDEIRLILEKCKFVKTLGFRRANDVSVRIFRSIGEKVFQAEWESSDYVQFARATFTREELLDYLEASRWLEKNNFIGERKEEKPADLILLRGEHRFLNRL